MKVRSVMAANKTFMLVRWIGEESLSVIPATENRNGDTPIVGRCGEFKWGGKFYEGEILALSGKLHQHQISFNYVYMRSSFCCSLSCM